MRNFGPDFPLPLFFQKSRSKGGKLALTPLILMFLLKVASKITIFGKFQKKSPIKLTTQDVEFSEFAVQ